MLKGYRGIGYQGLKRNDSTDEQEDFMLGDRIYPRRDSEEEIDVFQDFVDDEA